MRLFLQILIALLTVIAALIGLLRTKFVDRAKDRYPLLQRIEHWHLPLTIASAVAISLIGILSVVITLLPDRKDVEVALGPHDDLASVATYIAFEKEIVGYPDNVAGQSRDFFRAGERDLKSGYYAEAATVFKKSVEALPTTAGYLNLGVALVYVGDLTQSETDLSTGLARVSGKHLPELEPAFLVALGVVTHAKGNPKSAIQYFQRALEHSGNAPTLTKAAAEANIGTALFELNRFDDAFGHLNTAATWYDKLRDYRSKAQVLSDIASLKMETEDLQSSLNYNQQALDLSGDDVFARAKALNNRGELYALGQEPTQARNCYDDALRLAKTSGSQFLEASILNNIADLLNNGGEPKKSLELSQQALAIYKNANNLNDQAAVSITRGNSFAYQQDIKQALDLFREANSLFQETENILGQAKALGNMAGMYRLQKDHESAFQAGLRSLELLSEVGQLRAQANAFIELGNTCRVMKEFKCAETMYQVGLNVGKGLKDFRVEGIAAASLGGLYIDEKSFSKSIEFSQNALTLLRGKTKYLQGQADALVNLAIGYEQTKQCPAALSALLEARGIYVKLGGKNPQLPLINQEINGLEKLGAKSTCN
jgi:tetratricopeptide (TPR) repeat protein